MIFTRKMTNYIEAHFHKKSRFFYLLEIPIVADSVRDNLRKFPLKWGRIGIYVISVTLLYFVLIQAYIQIDQNYQSIKWVAVCIISIVTVLLMAVTYTYHEQYMLLLQIIKRKQILPTITQQASSYFIIPFLFGGTNGLIVTLLITWSDTNYLRLLGLIIVVCHLLWLFRMNRKQSILHLCTFYIGEAYLNDFDQQHK